MVKVFVCRGQARRCASSRRSSTFCLLYFSGPGDQLYVMGIVVMLGALQAGSHTLTPSVQADQVARDTLETGQHREGTYFAVMNLVEKSAAGGAVGLTGVALGVIGFQPGAVQAPEAIQALRVLISVLPAALVVLSAAILVGTGRSKTRLRQTIGARATPAN